MKQEHKDRITKWVAALRSGKYEQGQGSLRTPDSKYCCLGVACEVYKQETGQGEWVVDGEIADPGVGWAFAPGIGKPYSGTLPIPVYEWFGLEDGAPWLIGTGSSLVSMNDARAYPYDFAKIADAIEKEYLNEPTIP